MTYPIPYPGKTDTSAAAAEKVAPKLGKLHRRIIDRLAALGSTGATGTELAQSLAVYILTIRPRLTELAAMGLIVDSGKRVENPRGNPEIVYVEASCVAQPQ